MPLQDHFSDQSKPWRQWGSFLSSWAVHVVGQLNLGLLRDYYRADPHVKLRFRPEKEEDFSGRPNITVVDGQDVDADYMPPAPSVSATLEWDELHTVEVIVRESGGRQVAAVKFATPTDKKCRYNCQAFVAKCAGYLQAGSSLIVVDIDTTQSANLHGELLRLVAPAIAGNNPSVGGLFCAAYRVVGLKDSEVRLDVWHESLALGKPLPTLPLWLGVDEAVPLNLEESYATACRNLRLQPD